MAYDPKAVKIPKAIRRFAAYETDPHKRGEIMRSYVKVFESDLRGSKRGPKDK
jgi:hypothetical protein